MGGVNVDSVSLHLRRPRAVPQSVALNDSVRDYPYASARYRDVFNRKAEDMGFAFRWVKDDRNFNAIDADELQLNAAAAQKYGVAAVPARFTAELADDVHSVLEAVEQDRLTLVEASALYHKRYPYRAPLELLSPPERRAADILEREAKPLINRINARQNHPQADAQSDWVKLHGDYYSKIMLSRFHYDECAGPIDRDPGASLLPTLPDRPAINGMIAADISGPEFAKYVASQTPDSEGLRPTTLLSHDASGAIVATPLPQHPSFRGDHQALAGIFERVAALAVDGQQLDMGLQRQLRAWAQYFRTGTAADEKAAAQATIDAGETGGALRLHVGPSESYWPDNIKFPYLMTIGIRDPGMTDQLRQWRDVFPQVEQSLADVPHYQPRELSTRGGFADPMYQITTAGFLESYGGREPRGANYPNYSYGAQGSNRFILMETLPPLVRDCNAMADRLLDESLSIDAVQNLDDNVVLFATGHESGHLVGPQRDHVTPSGQREGVAFGARWGSAEEPKADLTALELAYTRARLGQIDETEKRELMQASVLFAMALYPGKAETLAGSVSDHPFGYAMELGYYFQSGALSLNEAGKIHLDFVALEKSSHELWKKIIGFQAAGDVDGFMKFANDAVAAVPDTVDAALLEQQKSMHQYFIERHM
jgi:hypothetical protein